MQNKQSMAFWKSWKSKVCNSKTHLNPSVNVFFDEAVVIELLKSYFEKVCSNNSAEYNSRVKLDFHSRLAKDLEIPNQLTIV